MRNWWQVNPRAVLVLASTFAASFIVALIPFVLIYLPVMRNIGPRSFAEYLLYAPQFIDAINVGPSNIFWGREHRHLVPDRPAAGSELLIAITPLVWVLVGAATLIAAAQRPLPTDSSAIVRRAAGLAVRPLCRPVPRDDQGRLAVAFRIFYGLCPAPPRSARLSGDDRRQSAGRCHCARLRRRAAAALAPPVRLSRESRPCSAGACVWSRSISRPQRSSRGHSISLACSMCRLLRAHAGASTSATSEIGSPMRSRSMRCWSRWSGKGRRSTDIPACPRRAGICSTPRMPPTSNTWRPGSPAKARGCLSRRRRGGNLDVFTMTTGQRPK